MRNGTGRLPAVPDAAIVLRTADGKLLWSAQARSLASQVAGVACCGTADTTLSAWRAAHRLRLELVIVPRDEPTPPHLEQGIEVSVEVCH